ncbi:MAG: hypothetical protein Ct9H300mP28_25950 [Pseudomonadota bacterium]|nr:MAG: hypothetical protein Ct9H300mP28_25950 [Pseudomonadota bacterium]
MMQPDAKTLYAAGWDKSALMNIVEVTAYLPCTIELLTELVSLQKTQRQL